MANSGPLVWDPQFKKPKSGGLLLILGPALVTGASHDGPFSR